MEKMDKIEKEEFARGFLGTGWKFPVEVDQTTGRIKTVSYEEDIKESVSIILKTRKGERMMMPEFGCDAWKYTFENLNASALFRMEQEIKQSVIRWEPRITEVEIHVLPDHENQDRLNIHIQYVVRSTNNPYNFVYPYYRNEGFGK